MENESQLTEEQLYEHYRFEIDKGQESLRIDKFLMNRIENISRNKIQNAAKAGSILVNGKAIKPNYKVKPNDTISIVLATPPRTKDLIPEDIPFDIVYEDEDLVVINKEAGMVVHPGVGNHSGTLVNALAFHFQNLPNNNQDDRPGLVHRIDKNTTGLLVVAKTEYAMTHLAKQFFQRTIERKYIALVWGDIDDEGTIEGYIGRHPRFRKRMTVFPEADNGKPAITRYKMIERLGYVTLVECKLETGRTHQIRVHMEYFKHPLFNDETYGVDRIVKGTAFTKYKQFIDNCFKIMPRHCLHAEALGFVHPTTNEKMYFQIELPDDFKMLLDKWRKYSTGLKDING